MMPSTMLLLGLLYLLFLHGAAAQYRDDDLLSFVTLPDVRALKFEINHIDRERQFPGYWFVAPYGQINPEPPTQKYQQYQVGPYIYDNDGTLIWAGSPLYDNRNIFDFKVNWNIDDDPHLSFILQHEYHHTTNKGSGMILNKNYELEHQVDVTNDIDAFNIHEFNILDGGHTALACTYRDQVTNLIDFGRPSEGSWVITGGLVELDVATGDVLFSWDSLGQITLDESVRFDPKQKFKDKPGSDYVHINAVDKNAAGDYIVSMRFTNTIYLISGQDGDIVWRLGGNESDFDQDFNFSKQHDVKFIESNQNHHIISFLNNASDEEQADEGHSSALYVAIDETTWPMTARVIKRIDRPDGGLTRLRGNVQTLPNNNTFVGWSQQGYQSEHAPNGDLLMWARFVSDRFSSYRSYKFDWIGRPNAPPDLVASVYGASVHGTITTIHVSWNGATDVAGWKFYARAYDRGEDVFIGYANKTGFETIHIVKGFMDWISAKAIDAEGNVMKTSEIHRSNIPSDWEAVGFDGSRQGPPPDDPSLVVASSVDNSTSLNSLVNEAIQVDPNVYLSAKEVARALHRTYLILRGVAGFMFLALLTCCVIGAAAGIWLCFRRRRRSSSYRHIPSEERETEPVLAERISLRDSIDG